MAAGSRNRQPQRERTWNFPCFFHVLCCCTHRFDKFELLSAAAKRGRLNLPSCQTPAGTSAAATRNRHTTACASPAIFVRHESQNGTGRTLLPPADHRSLGCQMPSNMRAAICQNGRPARTCIRSLQHTR